MSTPVRRVLLALTLALVLFPLAVGKPGMPPTLKADEPAYYLMALSLWHDRDLRCETRDLHRLFDEYPWRTRNLILMSGDGWSTVYFGKPYIYSLAAAPLAGLFGANGMVAFNMALLMLMVWLGTLYLGRYNPEPLAALFACGFFLLSSGFAYVFWLHPELFMMAAVTVCLYLGFTPAEEAAGRGRLGRLLASPVLRAAVSGAALTGAVYLKPVMAAFALPVLYAYAAERRWRSVLVWVLAAGLALGALAGLSTLWTGHPSAYLGVARRGVNIDTPLRMPVDPVPVPIGVTPPKTNSWFWILRVPELELEVLGEDLGYFLWGRHTGLVLYMPFSLLALGLFLAGSRRSGRRWALLASLAVIALFFLIWIPFNWHGGGGFVGNRYFVNAYPGFLFLVRRIRPAWLTALGYAAGGLLLGPLLFTPFGASVAHPTLQAHTRSHPFKLFPLEHSIARQIPGYRGSGHSGVWFRGRKDVFKPAGDEMWLHGATEVELWLKSVERLDVVVFQVRSLASDNLVELSIGDARSAHRFAEPDTVWRAELPAGDPARERTERGARVYYYRLRVRSETGADPSWTDAGAESFYLGAALTYLGTREQLARDLYAVQWGECLLPERVTAGQHFEMVTRVTNRSAHTWPSRGATRVNLSYHWLDARGDTVVLEGERTLLDADVPPGGLVAQAQGVVAPGEPGHYTLVLDAVYERVTWFSQRNPSAAHRIPVDVRPAAE